MATIMSAKELAANIKANIKNDVSNMDRPPTLAVIRVGNDPASQVYVRNKKKDCEECGIVCKEYFLYEIAPQKTLVELIKELNKDNEIDGILVQLPLPQQINEQEILETIDPRKDVDCFHPINVGKLVTGNAMFYPCTPYGIITLLKAYNINVDGMNCVVIGRSNIVGKPMTSLLTQMGATVTTCHSHTKNLKFYTQHADLIVSAVGKAGFLTADMVKNDTIVVDVGINRNADGKLCGDADFDALVNKCSHITPVPGSVGLMTRAMLMHNTVKAAQSR